MTGTRSIAAVARLAILSALAFLMLAGLTRLFGEDVGLGAELTGLLSVIFLVVAAGDTLAAVLLRARIKNRDGA